MPEFTLKEVRVPELHLPEVKRDEIVRALSGIRVPEVGLARVEPRRRLRDAALGALPARSRALAGVDAGRLIAAAITTARIVRPASKRARWSPFRRSRWDTVSRSRDNLIAVVRPAPRRSRRRIAAVVIVLVVGAAWLLFRNPAVRSRLDRAASDARTRMGQLRAPATSSLDKTGGPAAAETTLIDSTDVAAAESGVEIAEPAGDPA